MVEVLKKKTTTSYIVILIIILLTNFILSLRETPLCRVPHTAKRTRQPGIGKAGLCRVLYIGHTAKGLPCATLDPRQNKVASQER